MQTQIIRPPAFQRPTGKLKLSGNQENIADSTATLVELDTIPANYKDGIENIVTHRITPGRAGFYSIAGVVQYYNNIATKFYESLIYVSAASVARSVAHSSLTDQICTPIMLPCFYLSPTDYVELYAYHEAGVGTIDISASYTYLSVQRVR